MTEGQQIIFKHPLSGEIRTGIYSALTGDVIFVSDIGTHRYPAEFISEWCDAQEAFQAFKLQHTLPTT